MAIGDPFGALDAEPEEDWRYKEAIDGLKNDPSQQPQQPASSWYDTLNDVAHFPHRIIGALTAPRQDTPPGRLTVLRNVADIVGPTLKNAFTAPHRVMTGELDPESPKGTSAALDMALLGGASVAGALERGAASPGVDLRILGKKVLSDSAPTAAPIALAEHAQPFYSGLEHAVASVPQGSMSGQQWLGTLANKAGVKPEELDWAGARDMLTANADKPVTKAQLQDHLDANKVQLGEVTKEHMPESWKDVPGDIQYKLADMHRDNYFDGRYGGAPDLPDWYENIAQHSMEGNETGIDGFFNPPRYTEYTLPGGKNYREKLLTLPARPSTPEEILDRAKKEAKLQYPEDSFEDLPEPIRNGYLKFGEQLQPSSYKSPHWEERNVLGHLRMTDRDVAGSAPLDADAVTAFNDHQAKIEALRDQQGAVGKQIGAIARPAENARRDGLRADLAAGKITPAQFNQEMERFVENPDLFPLQDKLQQLRAAEDELRKSAPPQPQPDIKPALHVEEAQSDWHQNGRELGYDGDTSTWVAKPSEGGSFWKVETKNGKKLGSASGVKTPEEAIAKVAESVPPIPSAPFKSTPAWSSLLMKRALHEAAATGKTRISWTPGEAHPTNPKNLGRAGEEADAANRGMQAFYDKMLPDLMNKIGKPHGVSVQKGFTEVGKPDSLQLDRMGNGVYRVIDTANRGAQVGPQFRSAAEARAWIDTSGATKQPVHYMDIPESLRHQLLTKGMPLFEDSSAAAPIAAAQHIGEGNVARPRPSEAMPRDPNDLPAAGAKYPQYAESYPPVGPPQLSDKATGKPIDAKGKAAQKLIDDGKAYWAKQNTPEATAFQKDRNAIQKEMDAKGYDPFFPPEERSHVDPANHPTSLDMTRDALPAKQETVEKYRKMFNTPAARARLQKAFDEGKKLGNAKDWYAMRQLEDQYVKHLGPEEGRKRFANEFAHTMAATTGGADPTSNLLLAHYVQWASRHGGIPEASHQLPFPIGGRYVSNNIKQFQKMPEEGGFTEANPKRHDFGHAFLGHANKATMDEQMSGGLVPGMQIPPGDSYGVAAQVVHDLAKKNGVTPRDFQDITWAGLKKMKVGDKFKYKGPMIQDVNDAIERTHRLTGMPRNEIVRRGVVKKEIPLYSNPAPLGALDAEQDRSP